MTGEADGKTKGAGADKTSYPDPFVPTAEQMRARRRRNIAIALAIGGFAVFFYVITIAKLGVGILNRPL
ncbi:MAG: hypothetical protein NWT00_10930 [Beijerinckiaceae bacterium]|nr:hypothetical protein [Beijerinckiaceae bacterium]